MIQKYQPRRQRHPRRRQAPLQLRNRDAQGLLESVQMTLARMGANLQALHNDVVRMQRMLALLPAQPHPHGGRA